MKEFLELVWDAVKFLVLLIPIAVVFVVAWVLFLFPYCVVIYPLIKFVRWILGKDKLLDGHTSHDYDGYGSP